jgi:hypothetical protein
MRSTRMTTTRLVIFGGLIAFAIVLWLQSRYHTELFADLNLNSIPDPHTVFKRIREILDRYDDPTMIHQITSNIDKDPSQLARQQLGIQN